MVAPVRVVRNYSAATFLGCAISSFICHLFAFYGYLSSRPRAPNPALGLTHPLNNHGSVVYVSAAEGTGLALLMWSFLGFGFVGALLSWKTFVINPQTRARLRTVVAKSDDFTPLTWRVAVVAAVIHAGLVGEFGGWFARLSVVSGNSLPAW
jgi:hypothetical protein